MCGMCPNAVGSCVAIMCVNYACHDFSDTALTIVRNILRLIRMWYVWSCCLFKCSDTACNPCMS